MKETIISVLFAIGYVILVLLFIAVPVFCLLLIWGGNEILILRLLGTDVQAKSLLDFCNSKTIDHVVCYGNGTIMFPMWIESCE